MKLRLLEDSIRLRLSRSEVGTAADNGVVECRTRFPDGTEFTYALEAEPEAQSASASYEQNRMTVRLPAAQVSAWASDDEAVSLRGELELASGDKLKLLVEKDFQCLTPRGDEDQSDLFPNPDPC